MVSLPRYVSDLCDIRAIDAAVLHVCLQTSSIVNIHRRIYHDGNLSLRQSYTEPNRPTTNALNAPVVTPAARSLCV